MANRNIGTPVVAAYLIVWWGAVAALLVYATSNAPPGAPVLKWKDEVVYSSTKLSVEFESESLDPDGDKVEYTYAWYLNGELVADKMGKSIPNKDLRRDQHWAVVVSPNDGSKDGTGCGLPWRQCAGDPSADARLEITVSNSPPRARVRFVNAEGKEPESFTKKDDVHLALSCADNDFMDAKRDAAAAAKAAGTPPPPPPPEGTPPTPEPDPCTYTMKWYRVPVMADGAPPPAEPPADGAEVPPDFEGTPLPASQLKPGEKWRVVVTANDGEIDGPSVEETVEIAP